MKRIKKEIVDRFLENPKDKQSIKEFTECISEIVYKALEIERKKISAIFRIGEERKRFLLDAFVSHLDTSKYLAKEQNEGNIIYAIEDNNLDHDIAILICQEDIPSSAKVTKKKTQLTIDKWIEKQGGRFMRSKIHVDEIIKLHDDIPTDPANELVIESFLKLVHKAAIYFCSKYHVKSIRAEDISQDFYFILKEDNTYYNSFKNFRFTYTLDAYIGNILNKYFKKYIKDRYVTVTIDFEKGKNINTSNNNEFELEIDLNAEHDDYEEDCTEQFLKDEEDEIVEKDSYEAFDYASLISDYVPDKSRQKEAAIKLNKIIEELSKRHPMHARLARILLENYITRANGGQKLSNEDISMLTGIKYGNVGKQKSDLEKYIWKLAEETKKKERLEKRKKEMREFAIMQKLNKNIE